MKRKNIAFVLILIILITNYITDVKESKVNTHVEIAEETSGVDLESVLEVEGEKNLVTVERVVDGDTFVLDTGEKVRMILINTPESVHPDETKNTEFGKIASEFTKNLLEGKEVILEKDVSETDRYGRLLRYVYLEDGTFVNELIVKEGYAQIATYPPDVKYKDIILAAEKYARENNKGLWAK